MLAGPDTVVLASMEGWSKPEFQALAALAAERCGAAPPAFEAQGEPLAGAAAGVRLARARPRHRTAARRPPRRGALASRRIRVPVAAGSDELEFLFDRGLTDGLPVVPPTEARVLRMLEGTSRAATDVVAHVPPNLAPATVEKVAINAVMAGCKPEYLPVVLAAVEAACTDDFNLHGVLATTYFVGPLIIVNGPIRREIGINCGPNAFGQGARANSTIGRALQLLVRNVGGGRPGEVDMATLGQPGKVGACIGELEEESCWEPLHVERGFKSGDSTVTVFAAEAPRAIRDQLSRSGPSLAGSMGLSLESIAHVKLHHMDQALLVVSPEHARTFGRDGYTKDDVRARIQEVTARPLRDLLPSEELHKGMRPQALPRDWLDANGQPTPEALDRRLSKFQAPENILIMVAGGTAGKFSAAVGGWASGEQGSKAVTRRHLDRAALAGTPRVSLPPPCTDLVGRPKPPSALVSSWCHGSAPAALCAAATRTPSVSSSAGSQAACICSKSCRSSLWMCALRTWPKAGRRSSSSETGSASKPRIMARMAS